MVVAQHSTRRILFAMSFALVLVIASMTSLNQTLPELAVSIGASNTELTWISDAYTLVLAATVLPLGALSDRYGRRTLLLLGIVIFGLASLGAAMQTSPMGVIWFRALTGLGAAMIMPGTLSTITATFPEAERARGVATWTGFAGAGAIVGLFAAGALLEVSTWQSVFIMSAVIAVLAGIAALLLTPNTKDEEHTPLDPVGSVLSALTIGALVFAIIHIGEDGWDHPRVLITGALGLLSGVLFVIWERRYAHPLLDLGLFRQRWFTLGSLAVTTQFMAQLGFIFIALQYLQIMLGLSPLRAAVWLMPLAAAVLPMSQATPILVRKVGTRVMVAAGLMMLALGLIFVSRWTADSSFWQVAGTLLIFGTGVAWTATPATTAITGSLPRAKQGVASAVNDTTREFGAALGVAIMGTVFAGRYRDLIQPVVAGLPTDVPEHAREAILRSPAAGLQLANQAGPEANNIRLQIQQAFSESMSASMLTVAVLVVLFAVVVAVAGREHDRADAPAPETVSTSADD